MAYRPCPKCGEEINGSRALKEHMTDKHGGYNSADIPSETTGQAREILGSTSLADLGAKAPMDDAGSGEGSPSVPVSADSSESKQKRTKKPSIEEQEQQKRRKQALETIGNVICKKTAAVPYKLWAKLAGDDSLKLTEQEHNELSAAYLEICRGYDTNFTHPLMGILAAMAINADFIAARIGITLGEDKTEKEVSG